MADLHAAIGVQRGAPPGAVQRRTRTLFLLVHPDKCSLPRAAEAFHIVETAKRVLTDAAEWRKHQAEQEERRALDREAREQALRTADAARAREAAQGRKDSRRGRQSQKRKRG